MKLKASARKPMPFKPPVVKAGKLSPASAAKIRAKASKMLGEC